MTVIMDDERDINEAWFKALTSNSLEYTDCIPYNPPAERQDFFKSWVGYKTVFSSKAPVLALWRMWSYSFIVITLMSTPT